MRDSRRREALVSMSEVTGVNFDELTVIEDEVTDALIEAYVQGHKDAIRQLDLEAFDIDLLDLDRALALEIAGKTYLDRIRDGSDIEVLTDTESHRMYNTGMMNAAKGVPGVMKTWHTMEDDRVRDQHYFLEGVTIPYDEYFHAFDGDYGLFPGNFTTAENNANCRCVLTLSRY